MFQVHCLAGASRRLTAALRWSDSCRSLWHLRSLRPLRQPQSSSLRGSTPSKRQHPRGLAAAQDRPAGPHTGRHAHAGGHKTVRRSLHRARPGLTAGLSRRSPAQENVEPVPLSVPRMKVTDGNPEALRSRRSHRGTCRSKSRAPGRGHGTGSSESAEMSALPAQIVAVAILA